MKTTSLTLDLWYVPVDNKPLFNKKNPPPEFLSQILLNLSLII